MCDAEGRGKHMSDALLEQDRFLSLSAKRSIVFTWQRIDMTVILPE